MYSQYSLHTQPLSSSSQPQATPSHRQQNPRHPSPDSDAEWAHMPQGHNATARIGQPIQFSTGPYQGHTIRMELCEIQKADLGRKYARVDRRPLDPPPVVHLKMFDVHHIGTERQFEKEMDYDDVQVLGLLCTVDLFPVPGPEVLAAQLNDDRSAASNSASPTQTTFFSSSLPSSPSSTYDRHVNQYPQPMHGHRSEMTSSSSPSGSRARAVSNHFSGYMLPTEASPDIVHHLDSFPITENSKQTQALVGATFVQPVVMDYQGSKAIIFVFADLAVKIEGHFILRYRVFDIFARPFASTNDLIISAECYGGTFRVYSTKEFPGLSASTELTKRLSLWGVRLNIRVTERRRRKRPASDGGRRSPTPDDDGTS